MHLKKGLPKQLPKVFVGPKTPAEFKKLINSGNPVSQLGYTEGQATQDNCDISDISTKKQDGSVLLPSCGYSAMLRLAGSSTEHMAVWLSCKRWNCNKCGPVKKKEWTKSLIPFIDKEIHIEKLRVSLLGWSALKRRVQRAGGEYVRLRYEDDFLIFTSACVGGMIVPKANREAELEAAIKAMPYAKRAISSSRGWKKASVPPSNEWEMVGTSATGIQKMDQIIRACGIPTQPLSIGQGQKPGIRFSIPTIIAKTAYPWFLWMNGVWRRTKEDREKLHAA